MYISDQIQNKLIEICSDIQGSRIIMEVRHAADFSVFSDDTANITGTEQLSIGVCYPRYDKDDKKK